MSNEYRKELFSIKTQLLETAQIERGKYRKELFSIKTQRNRVGAKSVA